MKVGVCLHGYSFRENGNWEKVVWGVPEQDLMGRIPTAVWASLYFKARTLVFGTGTVIEGVMRESEIEYRFLKEKIATGDWKFSELSAYPLLSSKGLAELVDNIYVLDTEGTTTIGEIIFAKRIFDQRGIEFAVHIGSSDHISRVAKECGLAYYSGGQPTSSVRRFCVIPSQVPYTEEGAKGVIVAEPTPAGREYLRRVVDAMEKE